MNNATLDTLEYAEANHVLKSLGLTRYETLVYLSLLKDGPQDNTSLTRLTGIPSGKIYAVTKNLAGKGWIKIAIDERPKIVYPLNPEIAMAKRIAELEDKLDLLSEDSNKALSKLKTMFDKSTVSMLEQDEMRSKSRRSFKKTRM